MSHANTFAHNAKLGLSPFPPTSLPSVLCLSVSLHCMPSLLRLSCPFCCSVRPSVPPS